MNMLDANPADRPTIGVALAIFVSLLASFAQSFGGLLVATLHVMRMLKGLGNIHRLDSNTQIARRE